MYTLHIRITPTTQPISYLTNKHKEEDIYKHMQSPMNTQTTLNKHGSPCNHVFTCFRIYKPVTLLKKASNLHSIITAYHPKFPEQDLP